MKRPQSAYLPLLTGVLLFLASCESATGPNRGAEPDPRDTATVLIPETTKVLDNASIAALASADSGRIVFSSASGQVAALKAGDVVVTGISDKTPHGLLRKITSAQTEGGRAIFQTGPAKLTEAVERGRGTISVSLQLADVATGQLAPAVARTGVLGVRDRVRIPLDRSLRYQFAGPSADRDLPPASAARGPDPARG